MGRAAAALEGTRVESCPQEKGEDQVQGPWGWSPSLGFGAGAPTAANAHRFVLKGSGASVLLPTSLERLLFTELSMVVHRVIFKLLLHLTAHSEVRACPVVVDFPLLLCGSWGSRTQFLRLGSSCLPQSHHLPLQSACVHVIPALRRIK